MTKEGHNAAPEVAAALDALEKQTNRVSFKLDLSKAHRVTSGDIVAIANFMAKNPRMQELLMKGHFHQYEYINKTLLVTSRQSLQRFLLTINTNKSLPPLSFDRAMVEAFCANFKSKSFPKLNTFGLYRAVFTGPELIPIYVSGLAGVELASLHLSLAENASPVIPMEIARALGSALRHQKSLRKLALLNFRASQAEAEALVESLVQPGGHQSNVSQLYLSVMSPGALAGTRGIQAAIVDPSSLAASFLSGIERRLRGEEKKEIVESGVSLLLSVLGFQKMVLGCIDDLKRKVGGIVVSLCSERVASKKPRNHRAIRSLVSDVANSISIRFEADGTIRGSAEILTEKVAGVVESVKADVEAELIKSLEADAAGSGSGHRTGGIYSGSDSYGNSDGYGSRSKSGNTVGSSFTKGKRRRTDKDDCLFGSFCSSSPISDDIEEDFEECAPTSSSASDPMAVGSGRTGIGGRPVFSSTGTLWEYNPSSLILDNLLTVVAHSEQNCQAFERPSGRSSGSLVSREGTKQRLQIFAEFVPSDAEISDADKIALFEAIQPNVVGLFMTHPSLFAVERFRSLKEVLTMLSRTQRTEVASLLPPSSTEGRGYSYVHLVN